MTDEERLRRLDDRSLELFERLGQVLHGNADIKQQNAEILRRVSRLETTVQRHREKLRSVDDTGSHELAEHRDWLKWWKRTLVKVAIGIATVLVSAGAAALVSKAVVQSHHQESAK